MAQANVTVLAEVFPVQASAIPTLSAYRLDVRGGDIATIGGKLSYRLQRIFKGHWLWTDYRIVTDVPQAEEAITSVITALWSEQPEIFKSLLAVHRDLAWRPNPQVEADYAACGLFADLQPEVAKILSSLSQDLGSIRIDRVCDVRGWVVRGQPAISVSVASRLLAKRDLKTYAGQVSTTDQLIGLMVMDKTSNLKGEIVEVIGTVADHRDRLLKVAQREESKEIIRRAANNEPVVHVRVGRYEYDFVASALRIVVRTADYAKFGVNATRAMAALRLSPKDRSDMVGKIARIVRGRNVVRGSYRSSVSPTMFLSASDVNFDPRLRVGGGNHTSGERTLQANLRRYGFYKRSDAFPEETPVRIGVLSAVPGALLRQFVPRLQGELRSLQFASQIVSVEPVAGTSRDELERAVSKLQESAPHLLLALFPDSGDGDGEDEAQWGAYHRFKSLTVGMGIPSQVVNQSTMSNQYALANIALGALSKIGNIPFILSEPLPYADIIVGVDIARRKKERLAGSLNATAIARIYQNAGEFLQYVVHDAPLEGETIPDHVLQALFPRSIFAGKRALVHRDGLFRGNEKQALKEWARRLGAEFHLVELLKTGTPRIYGYGAQPQGVQQPPKGSALRLNDHEAFLVSSLPPFANVTPYPLHIRTEAPFPIEEAVHSVLALTLLHYGSLRTPRLPVTIHYSDEIAYLVLKGIKPKALEGTLPFWL